MSEIKKTKKSLNICYVAPDIPVPHTGDFIGGSTHVRKIAENFAKKGNKVIIIYSGVFAGKALGIPSTIL